MLVTFAGIASPPVRFGGEAPVRPPSAIVDAVVPRYQALTSKRDSLRLANGPDTGAVTYYQHAQRTVPHPFNYGGHEFYIAVLDLEGFGDVRALINRSSHRIEQVIHNQGKPIGNTAQTLRFIDNPGHQDNLMFTRVMALLNSPVPA